MEMRTGMTSEKLARALSAALQIVSVEPLTADDPGVRVSFTYLGPGFLHGTEVARFSVLNEDFAPLRVHRDLGATWAANLATHIRRIWPAVTPLILPALEAEDVTDFDSHIGEEAVAHWRRILATPAAAGGSHE